MQQHVSLRVTPIVLSCFSKTYVFIMLLVVAYPSLLL